jgi:hypothetical protein
MVTPSRSSRKTQEVLIVFVLAICGQQQETPTFLVTHSLTKMYLMQQSSWQICYKQNIVPQNVARSESVNYIVISGKQFARGFFWANNSLNNLFQF